ncbi:F0F1-ATPase subunit, putative [Tissierella praeacuta DSM 18095]|uniref:F0F1-ATPase subunit, putative n=1 Tax=Tissierella praeacuta DSM 18095 TaxID=1123404 RepID=A0A1M4WGY9_9FIRM|nr:AtpZ/AtpI family protein [Tissierella praeacuta]TCU79060.1 putative F0F1-ATPase subunit [Tissierella praeacuta]SHE80484.1 F0F1-ATPase subunit, putative [Tissierella praeacuta DSM 18095]SUO99439.1 Uncharacterized protein conserved in bacteria [Tissierella praeacuta]
MFQRSDNVGNKNYKDTLQGLALISQIGFSVITPILIGVYLGQFIDKKLGMNGIFSIIFIILGVGAGFLNIFKLARIKGNKRK